MLLGEYQHSLDAKGRVAIPAKFRDKLSAGAIITRGIDNNCLFIFDHKNWEALVEKLTALPLSQANSRAITRLMLSGAADVELDNQGRILIPDYLRTYAGLNKEIIVAGLHTRAEIWDALKWAEYKKKMENAASEIAEKLGELGI